MFIRKLLLALPLAALLSSPAPASTVIVDLESGQTILEEEPDRAVDASGVAPMVAVYTALDIMRERSRSLFDMVPSPWPADASKEKDDPEPAREIDLATLLQAVLMNGSPEALAAIPAALGMTAEEFSAGMNAALGRAGIAEPKFAFPCSETAPCTASARDVSKIAVSLYERFPIARIWGAAQTLEIPGIPPQQTANFFLERSPAITGIFVSPGNGQASAAVLSENPRGTEARIRRLIAVELNDPNPGTLRERLTSLFLRAYRDYETLEVYPAGTVAAKLPVFKSSLEEVNAVVPLPVYATTSRERMISEGSKAFDLRVSYSSPLIAPLKQGDRVGELQIFENGRMIVTAPLVAEEDVPLGSFLSRFIDTLRLALGQDALH